jgi:Cu+-exporting ATPase
MKVLAGDGFEENELLRTVASVERHSEHPLAAALAHGAEARGLTLAEPARFDAVTGGGVVGQVEGHNVLVGNRRLLQTRGVEGLERFQGETERLQTEGNTVVYAAIDGKAAGVLAIADPIKETTAQAIAELHRLGRRVVMLTGDNRRTASAVGQKLGIDEIHAEVAPQDKQQVVKGLREAGHAVAMAGDGMNDASALAAADAGIAMGTGADVAIESAGITLVKGDLRAIVKAIHLSGQVMRNIRQNLFFAFIYNVLGVPIAAGILYPFFGILLSPIIASAAMSFSSVSVVANALRLRKAAL